MTDHQPLPVAGYTAHLPIDGRSLALARTKMQEANMWAVRAIFQPLRIALPEDSP